MPTHSALSVPSQCPDILLCCHPGLAEFIRMAARFGATIVPFAAVGVDDSLNILADGSQLEAMPVVGDMLRRRAGGIPQVGNRGLLCVSHVALPLPPVRASAHVLTYLRPHPWNNAPWRPVSALRAGAPRRGGCRGGAGELCGAAGCAASAAGPPLLPLPAAHPHIPRGPQGETLKAPRSAAGGFLIPPLAAMPRQCQPRQRAGRRRRR